VYVDLAKDDRGLIFRWVDLSETEGLQYLVSQFVDLEVTYGMEKDEKHTSCGKLLFFWR